MEKQPADEVMPSGPWQFDSGVTEVFEDMLQRSIPQYQSMRTVVHEVGRRYVLPETTIADLGCSRGGALMPFVNDFKDANDYLGLEISEPMLEAARSAFAYHPHGRRVTIARADLRHEFPVTNASLVLCVLTLQFTPIEYRQHIVRRVFNALAPGGAFVLVEKVLGATAGLDACFVESFLEVKRRNGYSPEQINRKRLSLEGVLVPVTAAWNEELLRNEGFREVDCFWRHLNFAGWIAVKA